MKNDPSWVVALHFAMQLEVFVDLLKFKVIEWNSLNSTLREHFILEFPFTLLVVYILFLLDFAFIVKFSLV